MTTDYKSLLQKVKQKIIIDDDCWIWQGGCSGNDELPKLWAENKDGKYSSISLRRLIYESKAGKRLSPKLVMTTTCGCKRCVNPAHLAPVSKSTVIKQNSEHLSNMARRIEVATYMRQHRAKLTEDQARDIRTSSETVAALAEMYGVSKSHVNNIIAGKRWVDFKNPFMQLMR